MPSGGARICPVLATNCPNRSIASLVPGYGYLVAGHGLFLSDTACVVAKPKGIDSWGSEVNELTVREVWQGVFGGRRGGHILQVSKPIQKTNWRCKGCSYFAIDESLFLLCESSFHIQLTCHNVCFYRDIFHTQSNPTPLERVSPLPRYLPCFPW